MKKLMIAAAIVCAAAFAHAGSVVWGNTYGIDDYGKPGDAGFYNGTAYLIKGSAAAFFTAATAEGSSWADALDAASVIASATLTNGQTISKPSTGKLNVDGYLEVDGYSGLVTAFVTAQDAKGNFYISEELENTIAAGIDPVAYYYEHGGSYAAGTNPVALSDGYQTGGAWYSAVPEPTSGLLLLLGVAGLALRRRRA